MSEIIQNLDEILDERGMTEEDALELIFSISGVYFETLDDVPEDIICQFIMLVK